MKNKFKVSALAATLGLVLGTWAEPTPNYLTFTAQEAGSTVKLGWKTIDAGSAEVNTNGTWVAYEKNAEIVLANVGDKVQFRARNLISNLQPAQHIRLTGKVAASGSATSLIDANGGDPNVALPEKCFYRLFQGQSSLTTAPELSALIMTNDCYSYMFASTSLTKAPKLPATKLAKQCYKGLFSTCSLLQVPASMTHVTTLAEACCEKMYEQCYAMKAYNDNTHEGYTKPWKATSAVQLDGWSTDMFAETEGGVIGSVTAGETYYFTNAIEEVTVAIPEVAGATAELFAFESNGGWAAVATNEVPSNATVRVVWAAEGDKTLTGEGAANVFTWQRTFVADKAEQTAPAPTVSAAGGASEVSIGLDTRVNKAYFDAADILPIWYAAGAEVKVTGEGEASAMTLVESAAETNTLHWTPTAQDVYMLNQTGLGSAQITLTVPVEVTTNDLEVEKASVQVLDEAGQPLVAQTEGALAGKLIVPSNTTVRVVYTVTEPGDYFFEDGSKTYETTFVADKAVNAAFVAITKPGVPAQPHVKVGVVAQRYPWDGKIDVEYKALNTPAGAYQLKVKVEIAGTPKEAVYDNITSGIATVVFDIRKHFGEVTTKKCRVKASLEKLSK